MGFNQFAPYRGKVRAFAPHAIACLQQTFRRHAKFPNWQNSGGG